MDDEGEGYCRSATLDDLKLLLKALDESRAEYLLIGGYALAAHGYQRATTDIDILVPATTEAGSKIKRALLMLPRKVSEALQPEWFAEGETIRVADEFVVDIMFNACGETFESLATEVEVIDLDGIPVRTVSLAGLLKTKQTVRSKDAMDRLILERAIEKLKE